MAYPPLPSYCFSISKAGPVHCIITPSGYVFLLACPGIFLLFKIGFSCGMKRRHMHSVHSNRPRHPRHRPTAPCACKHKEERKERAAAQARANKQLVRLPAHPPTPRPQIMITKRKERAKIGRWRGRERERELCSSQKRVRHDTLAGKRESAARRVNARERDCYDKKENCTRITVFIDDSFRFRYVWFVVIHHA